MSLLSDRELTMAIQAGEEMYNKWFDELPGRKLWMPPAGFLPGDALWIDPFNEESVQPASVDLCLGGEFRYWRHPEHNATFVDPSYGRLQNPGHVDSILNARRVIDPMQPMSGSPLMVKVALDRLGDTFVVSPGSFVLAHTLETIGIGDCIAAQVYGKSSIGRLGLEVENAGYIDPGFIGQITLELKNTTHYPIRLTVGMPIAQMAVQRLTSPAQRPYGVGRNSRYVGQTGATESRYGLGRDPIGAKGVLRNGAV
jgi:dCTP deaminase